MTDLVERLRGMAGDYRDLVARFPAAREVIDDDEIDTIAAAAAEIEWLRGERNRLAADLAKAHLDIVAWIKKAQEAYR